MPKLMSTRLFKQKTDVGVYVGDGDLQEIVLGFRPRKVRIKSEDNAYLIEKFDKQPGFGHGLGRRQFGQSKVHRGIKLIGKGVTITDNGFTVEGNIVNKNGVTYYYEVK